jgi:MIP family channel proteins
LEEGGSLVGSRATRGGILDSTGKAVAAEFIATFALVVIGAGAVIMYSAGQLDLTGVALANGLVLFVFVSITAPISGGFVNPAVAIGLWTTGRIPTRRAGVLIAAELLGAIAGAFLLRFLIPRELFDGGRGGIPSLAPGISGGKGILLEAVASFFLVFAFYGTAVDERGPFAKTAGLTIGLVVTFDIMAFGPLTGAAMNPARWLGPAVATSNYANWYVWIVGPIAGGIIAGVVYWYAFLRGTEPVTP